MYEDRGLAELVFDSIPERFITGLLRQAPNAYKQAHSDCYSNPLLGPTESKWLLPYYRRGILEKLLRELANDCGLSSTIHLNSNRNTNYTLVRCLRLVLSTSAVANKADF